MNTAIHLVEPTPLLHICPDCHEPISGDVMPWHNALLCVVCWTRRIVFGTNYPLT